MIQDFARKTGDLEVLSRPDVLLMALAYELECERNGGDWRLRSTPGQKRVNGAPPGKETIGIVEDEDKKEAERVGKIDNEVAESTKAAVAESRGAWGTTIPNPELEDVQVESKTLEKSLEDTHITSPEVQPPTSVPESRIPAAEEGAGDLASSDTSVEEIQASEEEGSDEEGWITPSNLKQHQEKDANSSAEPEAEPKIMQVALITQDFAMQNVLLRMNLNLLSPSLQRIRQLKTWVLRCHACFQITKDMSKQFCPRCGKPTLLRTSCSTDKDGNFKVHLKKNMQWNTRGNVYSIPKPVAGTSNGKLVQGGGKGGWGQSLILAEDQKEYVSAVTGNRRKKERDLMDEDFLPGLLGGDRGRAGGRPKVGAGKNVNSKKRNK